MRALLPAYAPFFLATLFASAMVGCKQEPAVVDLADSGWIFADTPTPTGKEPKTISDLNAAGWVIAPASLSDIERTFGSDSSDLAAFKSKFQAGDTVVRLVAPSSYWASSAGWLNRPARCIRCCR